MSKEFSFRKAVEQMVAQVESNQPQPIKLAGVFSREKDILTEQGGAYQTNSSCLLVGNTYGEPMVPHYSFPINGKSYANGRHSNIRVWPGCVVCLGSSVKGNIAIMLFTIFSVAHNTIEGNNGTYIEPVFELHPIAMYKKNVVGEVTFSPLDPDHEFPEDAPIITAALRKMSIRECKSAIFIEDLMRSRIKERDYKEAEDIIHDFVGKNDNLKVFLSWDIMKKFMAKRISDIRGAEDREFEYKTLYIRAVNFFSASANSICHQCFAVYKGEVIFCGDVILSDADMNNKQFKKLNSIDCTTLDELKEKFRARLTVTEVSEVVTEQTDNQVNIQEQYQASLDQDLVIDPAIWIDYKGN